MLSPNDYRTTPEQRQGKTDLRPLREDHFLCVVMDAVLAVQAAIRRWLRRRRSRQELAALNEHLARDIGLTCEADRKRLAHRDRKDNHHMYRSPHSILLAVSITVLGANPSLGRPICKPHLSVTEVRLSELQNMTRKWTAVVAVDASHCTTAFGRFDINFVREKDNAPELEFSEQFTWQAGQLLTGQIEVSIDLWMDEAVHGYAISYVAPCGCNSTRSSRIGG